MLIVNGDTFKRYAQEKKITVRFGTVRKGKVMVTNSDELLYFLIKKVINFL